MTPLLSRRMNREYANRPVKDLPLNLSSFTFRSVKKTWPFGRVPGTERGRERSVRVSA